MGFQASNDAGMDRVIDGSACQTADFQQIAAFGLELRHLRDLLSTHRLVIDDNAISARRGDGAVE